jgi:hypothetical protein
MKQYDSLTDCKFIDVHYHANPDQYKRRWNAIEAGKIYQSLKGVVVLKSHLGPTSVQATLAQSMGLPVLPSLVLNAIAGGIDYRVIQQALSQYQSSLMANMIVHFPTITGRSFQSKLSREVAHPYLKNACETSETLFNSDKKLRKEVIDILKMAHDYPIVLSTGHASQEEIFRLIEACAHHKVPALLLNQPAHPLTGLNAAALSDLVQHEFVWFEQTALTYLLGHQDKEDFSKVLTSIPRVIYSSDLGQTTQMDIPQWFDFSKNTMAELGLSAQRQDELLRINPKKLLGL